MFNFEADDTNEKHNVEYKYFDLTFSRNGGGPAGGAHRDNSKFNSTIFFATFLNDQALLESNKYLCL
jgi:hypothetical protein